VVEKYSLNKIFMYQRHGMKNLGEELKIEAQVTRAAFGADKRQFESFLKSLETDDGK
jgi:hypothetical protein